MTGKKQRTIPEAKYKENRAKGNEAARKMRAEKGPAKTNGKEVDHIKAIAKGGSPTAPSNMELVPKTTNREKGSR